VEAEKLEVAAAHQIQPGTHQANCSVAEVMRLPRGARRHAAFAEYRLRNRAIGFAGKVCIERAEGERQSPAS
jgi:hypothetical protein